MHIRAFVGAAVLGLAMLAFAPIASADPAPNICVLNVSEPVTLDHALAAQPSDGCITSVAEVRFTLRSTGGDEDEAAGPSCLNIPATLDFASHPQHVDPGRCPA